jgi:hypothetical protein
MWLAPSKQRNRCKCTPSTEAVHCETMAVAAKLRHMKSLTQLHPLPNFGAAVTVTRKGRDSRPLFTGGEARGMASVGINRRSRQCIGTAIVGRELLRFQLGHRSIGQ